MRVAILTIALFSLMFQPLEGQDFLSASNMDFALNDEVVHSGNDPSEIKPPAVYAPKSPKKVILFFSIGMR